MPLDVFDFGESEFLPRGLFFVISEKSSKNKEIAANTMRLAGTLRFGDACENMASNGEMCGVVVSDVVLKWLCRPEMNTLVMARNGEL